MRPPFCASQTTVTVGAAHQLISVKSRPNWMNRAKSALGWGWTGDVHSLLSNYGMLTQIGLHVAAALYHYFIRRDGVLQRMLPGG